MQSPPQETHVRQPALEAGCGDTWLALTPDRLQWRRQARRVRPHTLGFRLHRARDTRLLGQLSPGRRPHQADGAVVAAEHPTGTAVGAGGTAAPSSGLAASGTEPRGVDRE
jgi:hypothetical protein